MSELFKRTSFIFVCWNKKAVDYVNDFLMTNDIYNYFAYIVCSISCTYMHMQFYIALSNCVIR